MNPNKRSHGRKTTKEERYYLFLNPYLDAAFTKCPKCETKTKIRKYCLMIHIEPHQLISLNKTCRYCPYCELIIVKKEELESLLHTICKEIFPDIIGNEYFVFGTMDRRDWRKLQKDEQYPETALRDMYPFKNAWHFKPIPARYQDKS